MEYRFELDKYFAEHPEEEEEFIEEMERLYGMDEVIDYPDHEWMYA